MTYVHVAVVRNIKTVMVSQSKTNRARAGVIQSLLIFRSEKMELSEIRQQLERNQQQVSDFRGSL
ncbi:hypothetical protein VL3N_02120 [Vagococcus lutrae]|nr:hypothetical protein VL2N_02120 [Vagococcus lutrae]GEQ62770.1 hypothetical protein VL3N_02120 [Vagococcus lutrae]